MSTEHRCGGIVGADTTRDDLLARGITPEAADELLYYREYLRDRAKVSKDGFRSITPERFKELTDYENGRGPTPEAGSHK